MTDKSGQSVLDESEGLGEMLLFSLPDALVCLLLGAHCLHHVHQIASHHISLLLLGRQGTLGRLQSLLLVLLHASGFLGIFPHGTLVSVSEEHALLLGRHVRCLLKHLAFLFNKNRVDSLVDSLGGLSFIVLVLAILETEQVLSHTTTNLTSGFLDLLFLLFTVYIK